MTTISLPRRPAAPPRYRNITGGARVRPARPHRPAPLTPPDALKPRFSHAVSPQPRILAPSPRPSFTPFTEPANERVAVRAPARPAKEDGSWLRSPFRSPARTSALSANHLSAPTSLWEASR
jgi:hypothetical protein